MTTSMILLSILGAIVILFLLSCWLIKTFASMSEEEKKIYDKELAKKALDEIELREKLEKINKKL